MNNLAEAQSIQSSSRIAKIFDTQRSASRRAPYPSVSERIGHIDKLAKLLETHQDAIAEAISTDFGNRPSQESKVLEIFGLISGCNYTRKRLKKWMKPQKRHVGLAFFGAKNTVIPQPKGVVGIVTPWNYPLFLALSPAISALAAGNRCIIKMASNSQTLAKLMEKLISAEFDESVLAIVPGVSAGEFTHLPWDHLVFTGSPATAKTVMETAAKYLTPVTLELGGKSPTIIADDFDIKVAAERLLYGKFLNAGQTCVAPDYVFVPRGKVQAFVDAAKTVVKQRYPQLDTADYTSIIDEKSYQRLSKTLDDATSKGAKAVNLMDEVVKDDKLRKIAPHVVCDVNPNMMIMQDEIFGPLLPLKPYDKIEEVIEYINENERPLALYLYSNNKALQNQVIYNTLSGGMCINDSVVHVAQHDMPFGGVGNSGMGHYHGHEGFIEFSKMRPIFKQGPMSGLLMMAPPYGATFDKMYKMMLKLKL